jgi:outer membrane usher protein FimD/PapC
VDDSRISVAGGVGYVADTLAFGRPITSSFGIVKVGELPGVGISVNGQRIGETNAQGTVFVPTLSPYLDNDISIAAETVPIDFLLPALSRKISPSLRSGALIEFPATRLQAFTGKLEVQQAAGTKPVEFVEMRLPKVKAQPGGFQTGHGGEFYLENLQPGTYDGSVTVDGKPCLFKLAVPHSTETFVELGDVVCNPAP